MELDAIRKPTESELRSIMTHLRMDVLERGDPEPKNVRLAKDQESREAAWKNLALRFYYLAVMPKLSLKRGVILTPEMISGIRPDESFYSSADELLTGG